ncbi:pyridine nucleotide-disulfide oxidoreductase [Streptomyces sp. SID8352]|uniref:NAD(P)/FAD-dependent oxidoreductase n=1 Tax=Streptomyces sp. SID8352 TaxID=2690338 RepID=UPI00139EEA1A|nr:pyridine nucleotide-disulfide oxidoreductase [Streptomyces sp. SID8352]MYU21297.1 pyridine nucleotide-disulfide oxidoreductase [Streptomyces sp. SID8352]
MSRRAVVIGAGVAGMLAAAALSAAVDEVTVLERDELPDGPAHRRGLPQGRHAHLLMAGGLAAMDGLVPGLSVREHLLAAGAREVALGSGMVALTPEGWFRRWRHEGPRMLTCSRALLDWAVREAVLGRTGVRLVRADVLGPTGTPGRVDGVRAATADGEEVFGADLVVDAGGRGSRLLTWLDGMGVTGVRTRTVDAGLVNATRVYRTPEGAGDFPMTVLHADPYAGRPGRSGMVLPIEGDRWMVSLGGTRGGEPPADSETFLRYARELPHPIVGRLISGAEPLTDVRVGRGTSNVRRHLERARNWPEGFVVLGDALATFNPVYGQGMSVAALEARLLGEEVRRAGAGAPGLARRAQRRMAGPVDAAWAMAVSQDVLYPDTRGGTAGAADRLVASYARRLTRAATGSYPAAAALWDLTSLLAPPTRLLRPTALLAALTGPALPPLSGPPLTPAEHATLRRLTAGGG